MSDRQTVCISIRQPNWLHRLVRRLSQWAWEAHLQPCSLSEAAKKEPGTLVTIYQYDAAACCRALNAKHSANAPGELPGANNK